MTQLRPVCLSKLKENIHLAREKDRTTLPMKLFLFRDYTLDANFLTCLIFQTVDPKHTQFCTGKQGTVGLAYRSMT